MGEYICPVCKEALSEEKSIIHDHLVKELSEKFRKLCYKIIREGKMPTAGWCEPDLFILQDLKLVKVIEVIVLDPYENSENSVYSKCWKIHNYYNPPEIVVFEPTNYLDKVRLPETKNEYKRKFGYEPKSYTQIQESYANKWKKNGLHVTFWNEANIITEP